MFTSKYKVVFGMMLFALYACSYPDSQSSKGGQTLADRDSAKSSQASDITKNSDRRKEDFLDSVVAKRELYFDQIKAHTNIDSNSYKADAQFAGDTVWYRNSKHPLAIVRYADSLIDKKLLLVFNRRGKCTA